MGRIPEIRIKALEAIDAYMEVRKDYTEYEFYDMFCKGDFPFVYFIDILSRKPKRMPKPDRCYTVARRYITFTKSVKRKKDIPTMTRFYEDLGCSEFSLSSFKRAVNTLKNMDAKVAELKKSKSKNK